MLVLIIGLVLFIGVHCVNIFALSWRERMIQKYGENKWKGTYSAISIVGFLLIIWGFGLARQQGGQLFEPAAWSRHLIFLTVPIAIILVGARSGYIGRTLQHPMLIGTAIWAAAHLAVNGDTASTVLFSAFLVWALLDLVANFRRQAPAAGDVSVRSDVIAIAVGLAISAAFIFFAHKWLIGVAII